MFFNFFWLRNPEQLLGLNPASRKETIMFKKIVGVVVAVPLLAGQVQAAVPTAVSTAISDAGADMTTIAAAVFVAIIGLLGFKLMRRAAH